MGVSKNIGTPKWMVKIMETPIKIDDLGVPLFLETPIFSRENKPFKRFFFFQGPGRLVVRRGWKVGTLVGFSSWKSYPPETYNKGLIAGLIKGNQWLINPLIRPAISWGKRSFFFGGG